MERTMTDPRRADRPRVTGSPRRSTIELAVVASLLAVTVAYTLSRFAGVGEMPIVLGTLLVASILGWTQPALRAAPRRTEGPVPVVVPLRRQR